jgi:hypothetical protein
MKHSYRAFWHLAAAAAALLLAASSGFATQTALFNLTGVGSGNVLGGVYTSPYAGDINNGSTIPVICDDFADESYVPETWTADVTSLSTVLTEGSGTDSTLRWSSGWNGTGAMAPQPLELDQSQAYSAAAILAIEILNSSGTLQEEYSFAMWELFDPTDASSALPSGDQSLVAGMVQAAATDALNGTINGGSLSSYLSNYNVTIYSYSSALNPNGPSCGGGPCPMSPPQEFISVIAPEASTPTLFAVDILGFIALVGFLRKRVSLSI